VSASSPPRAERKAASAGRNPFLPDEPAPRRPAAPEALQRTLVTPPADTLPATPASARATPGDRALWYGPYLLLRRVAVGGMAEVFMAKQGGIGDFEKVVAVKRLLPHMARDQELVEMFIHEAKVVAVLSHPHIVQIFGLGKISGGYYIAMEYVHGRDLRTIRQRAEERGVGVPMDIAVFIGARIASALAYAHQKTDDGGRPLRIIHRDVSPQNILVSYDGCVKLTDFGIARAVTRASATVHGLLRGKLAYMSPEQAHGKSSLRSDIFSIGAVLYELLTGQRPIQGDSEKTLLQALRSPSIFSARSLNPRIPESLDQVLTRALSPDPDQRFHDALHLQRALETALHDHPPATTREMSRFMDLLFDPGERGPSGTLDVPAQTAASDDDFEVDLEAPVEPPAAAPADHGADDMSVEKLLRRFRR